jgi:hypothetical protein
VAGFDLNPSFDQARSAAGRRSEAKAPRRASLHRRRVNPCPSAGTPLSRARHSAPFLFGGEAGFDVCDFKVSVVEFHKLFYFDCLIK